MAKAKAGHTPPWATYVAAEVRRIYNPASAVPDVRFTNPSKPSTFTSGRFTYQTGSNSSYAEHIAITPGTWPIDQANTLLHELAHWLAPRGEHHGPHYWETYWKVVQQFELPLDYCFVRSSDYKSTSYHIGLRCAPITPAAKFFADECYQRRLRLTQSLAEQYLMLNWNPKFPWRALLQLPT